MTSPALSDRPRRILATLVREYIETGEPVPSSTLTRRARLTVSSATIRNVLAQLEEMGFVSQPHTSAGRVPTDLGYRFYVDLLLESRRDGRDLPDVEARLRQQSGRVLLIQNLLSTASQMLWETSRHVGFAVAPANTEAVFSRIEFVPLSGTRLLVVVVTRGDQVSQKAVDLGEAVAPSELVQAANYLNSQFAGMTLAEVREAVRSRLLEERLLYDQLLALALRLADSSLGEIDREQAVFIEGTSAFVDDVLQANGVPLQTLRSLLRMVEEKQRLVRLLDQYIDGPGLMVVIGGEHSDPELRSFSLIASTYFDGRTTGTVGVLGPTRMRYSRAISAVDTAARAVSRVLQDNS